jgi:hypothetical protein
MTNDKEIEALKPCPFCGGEVELKQVDPNDPMIVICRKSLCEGSGLLIALGKRDDSYDKAKKAWNTRALAAMRPVNQEMLEALKRADKDILPAIRALDTFHCDGSEPDVGDELCGLLTLQEFLKQAILSAESGRGE